MEAVELFATNFPQPLPGFATPVAQVENEALAVLLLILKVVPGVHDAAFATANEVAPVHVDVCARMPLFAESKKLISTIRVFSSFL